MVGRTTERRSRLTSATLPRNRMSGPSRYSLRRGVTLDRNPSFSRVAKMRCTELLWYPNDETMSSALHTVCCGENSLSRRSVFTSDLIPFPRLEPSDMVRSQHRQSKPTLRHDGNPGRRIAALEIGNG